MNFTWLLWLGLLGILLGGVWYQMKRGAELEAELKAASQSVEMLQRQNAGLREALEQWEKDTRKAREESNALRRKISKLQKQDKVVDDWGRQRLPDSLRDLLRVPGQDGVSGGGG